LGGRETGWTRTNDQKIGGQLSRRPHFITSSDNAGWCKRRHARHLCPWAGIFQARPALSAVHDD
jgi:hypothetical protein